MKTIDSTSTLKPALGLAALTLFGVGDILGSGVYFLVGKISGAVGSAAWISFIIASFVAALTGLTYAELSSRYPKAGGAAHYTHQIFRIPLLTFFVIFFVAMSGLFSFATAAKIVSDHGMLAFPNLTGMAATGMSVYFLPLIFIGVIGVICALGVNLSSWVNIVCCTVEVAVLGLIIVIGFRFLGSTNLTNVVGGETAWSTTTVLMAGASMAFFAFVGFEDLANLAEEAKNPSRDIPIAICLAVMITSVIYCLLTAIAGSVIAPALLGESKTPLAQVATTAAPWIPTKLFSVVPIFAVLNTGLLNLMMASRLMYGMARRDTRILPGILAYVHPRFQTPLIAVIFGCAIVIIMILSRGDIKLLSGGTTTFLLIVFAILHLGLIRLKRDGVNGEAGTFKIPIFVPMVGLVTCVALLFSQTRANYMVAGSLIVVAAVLFLINRFFMGNREIQPID